MGEKKICLLDLCLFVFMLIYTLRIKKRTIFLVMSYFSLHWDFVFYLKRW